MGITVSSYGLIEFRRDVEACLSNYYSGIPLKIANKVIKIPAYSNRLDADVLICCQYRFYYQLPSEKYHSGVSFKPRNRLDRIINFPKYHSVNGTLKHKATGGWFKPTVRIFKNFRNYLVDNKYFDKSVAPSYFIECMLSNIPNDQFGTNYQTTVKNCHKYLMNNSNDSFLCLNRIRPLWGKTTENWNLNDANIFLDKIAKLWNNW